MSSQLPRRLAGVVPVVVTTAGLTAALATLTGLTRATRGLPEALGAGSAQIGPTAVRSPHFADGTFHNTEPSHVLAPGEAVSMIPALIQAPRRRAPARAGPADHRASRDRGGRAGRHLARPRDRADRGRRPVRAGRPGVGRAGVAVAGDRPGPAAPGAARRCDLPVLDAIVISHDHYDHLDLPTVRSLLRSQTAPFLVPLGIGAHLRGWGVPEDRIVELDWDEHTWWVS